jgi:hypothetical protein
VPCPTARTWAIKPIEALTPFVGQRATILELFTCKKQALLVMWDTFIVLNILLDVFD